MSALISSPTCASLPTSLTLPPDSSAAISARGRLSTTAAANAAPIPSTVRTLMPVPLDSSNGCVAGSGGRRPLHLRFFVEDVLAHGRVVLAQLQAVAARLIPPRTRWT